MRYYLFERGSSASFEMTIYGYYVADFIAINNNNYLTEVEVKVDKNDLAGELRSIECILENKPRDKGCSKFSKHKEYLNPSSDDEYSQRHLVEKRPSQFYFAIPKYLEEQAIKTIKKTNYGLIVVGENGSIDIVKKAKKIHNNKISELFFIKFLRKMSFENYKLLT